MKKGQYCAHGIDPHYSPHQYGYDLATIGNAWPAAIPVDPFQNGAHPFSLLVSVLSVSVSPSSFLFLHLHLYIHHIFCQTPHLLQMHQVEHLRYKLNVGHRSNVTSTTRSTPQSPCTSGAKKPRSCTYTSGTKSTAHSGKLTVLLTVCGAGSSRRCKPRT